MAFFLCQKTKGGEFMQEEQNVIKLEQKRIERLAYTLTEAAEAMGIGRNSMLKVVNMQGFPSTKVGRRWLIPIEPLKKWLERQATLN